MSISGQGSPEFGVHCFSHPLFYGDGGVAALLAGLALQRASTSRQNQKPSAQLQ